MKKGTQKNENNEFILGRLRLAQAILEESDSLEGRSGYDFESKKWWLHPRHEREALVVYLLLTCIDCLGQGEKYTSFQDWLRSKKQNHMDEKNEVLESLNSEATHLEAAYELTCYHQHIYGVRNAFYSGINNLPEDEKTKLLASVRLTYNPEYGKHGPNVSTPNYPLEDKQLEFDLKLKYLYGKRNKFTHRLDQYHSSSTPMMSDFKSSSGSSWGAMIRDSRLSYFGVHQEHAPIKSGGAYVYTVSDWPFVLFEVLYKAIDVPFERTSIKLLFKVQFLNKSKPDVVGYLDRVEHSLLKDYLTLEKNFWAELAGHK